MNDWTPDDEKASVQEGWAIFHVDSTYYDIQRDDETMIFESDAEAISWIFHMATAGSERHRRAINFIMNQENKPPYPSRQAT